MNTRLRSLTSEEFAARPECQKIIVHEHASRYGELVLDGTRGSFALAWRSDGIEPVVTSMGGHTWIGVDERVACIDMYGRVAMAMGVAGNLLAITILENCIAIMSDAVLLLVNDDFTARQIVVLQNLPSEVIVENGRIVVMGIEGDRLDVGAL
jgi:hypothetical protein